MHISRNAEREGWSTLLMKGIYLAEMSVVQILKSVQILAQVFNVNIFNPRNLFREEP